MFRQLVKAKRRQIIVDINTQRDFFLAAGKVCIRNHKRVLSHIRRIMAWARTRKIPVISVCEVYPGNNGADYCVDGTDGQKKISYSLFDNRINFPADGHYDLPRDILRTYRQVILHKRSQDPFDEPRIERLLSEVRAGEFILVGAAAEGAVLSTALGLLQRGKKVILVTDAIGTHNNRRGELAIRKMKAKGARLIETRRLAGLSHLNSVGICRCRRCRGEHADRNLQTHSLKA